MRVRALMIVRTLLVLALFPALAGCAAQDEPLQRADRVPPAPVADRTIPWAAPEEAEIHPGAIIHTEAADCPIHFLFARPDTGAVYAGTTAYCTRELGIGTLATIGEGQHRALLIYHSFQTMEEIGEDDPAAREYNDLAIFHIDRESIPYAYPGLPGGGPVALADGAAYGPGARLRLFAPSASLPEAPAWREGIVSSSAGDWALFTYTLLPGAPGELGGGVVDPAGNAVGVLVTLGVVPNPGANGVARLDTMLGYAREHARLDVELATWTL